MLKSIVAALRRKVQRHGLLNTVHLQFLKALQSLLGLTILRGVRVEQPDAAFLTCPEGYGARFLTAGQLRSHARHPQSEISSQFLDQALRRGDACYALRAGEDLAAYGWYARSPTPVGIDDLVLHFSTDYAYMYKGFTGERHRGRRLHAVGMTRALEHYRALGCKGLVSYVEATNFDSLKSCLRMGYSVFGSIYVIRLFGRSFALSSPGCSRFGFRLERAAPSVRDGSFSKR